jgi:parallel beta-helix repeat protein
MHTRALLRSLVAISVAASLAACEESGDDLAELLTQQEELQQAVEQQEQQQEESLAGSSGNDPIPPVTPEATPTVAESLMIEVPENAYPFVANSDTKFYYGLDEAVPNIPANAIELTFSGEYAPDGEQGPVVELLKELDGKTGDVVIVLPEGEFVLDRTFSLDMGEDTDFGAITSLTIMGRGIGKTIISYAGAENAKDGFLISNARNIELAHFSVIDSNNNAIKVTKTDGVYMHHLGTIWPGEPEDNNGAYGLYPVESTNVLVEDCFAFGSADAGVYVGQSENIVVRRNFAVRNVAGIEIENSKESDVYENYAYANTAGILIFDLPIGNGHYGKGARIFDNVSISNNTDNFAKVSDFSGGVHIAPPGSGLIVLASRDVEIFNNDIAGNDSFAIAMSSYYLADSNMAALAEVIADGWKPSPRAINIHDNRINGNGNKPRGKLLEDETLPIIEGFMGVNGIMPEILYDGLGQNLAEVGVGAQLGELPYIASENICVQNNGVTVGEVFDHTGTQDAQLVLAGMALPPFTLDLTGDSLFDCTLPSLPAYSVEFNDQMFGCGLDDNGEVCTAATPPMTRTEELTIAVPQGSYPDMTHDVASESFYYGLDEVEVSVPEGAIELNFDTSDPVAEFLEALDGASGDVTIVMPEGRFNLDRSFNIDMGSDGDFADITSLTIMGMGIDKTILSYTGSENAKDGFLVSNAKNIEFAHFSVEDSNNNAIKVTKSDGVWMHHVGTIWPGEPDADNGAYGLYPVESSNILVEDTIAFGSADAGVYVGQSDSIVVRRNFAIQNVAGIEIENSTSADVYDNYAYKNTAGILIFDLPIGNGKYGSGVRVFDNVSVANNTENFAKIGDFSGGVHIAPPGSGMIVLSTSDVEIFDNKIAGNDSFAVAISSYFLAESNMAAYMDPAGLGAVLFDGWRPVPRSINIHDNEMAENKDNPHGRLIDDIMKGFWGYKGRYADILYDGLGQNLSNIGALAAMGENPFTDDELICAMNNGSGEGENYVEALAGSVFDHTGMVAPAVTGEEYVFALDSELLSCSHEALPAYTVTFDGQEYGCGADDSSESCALGQE